MASSPSGTPQQITAQLGKTILDNILTPFYGGNPVTISGGTADLFSDGVAGLIQIPVVRISGAIVAKDGRIDRKNAYDHWESGFWGTQPNSDLDSAFSKLESYGLVPRTGPPNNLNIFTDFQNWFALLPKGLRFAESKSYADAEST